MIEQSGGRIIRKPVKLPKSASALEESFALVCRAHHFPAYVREHRFAPPRRWRLDFAWPELLIGIEIEGGIYTPGHHHANGKQIELDHEKRNAATAAGWAILYFGPAAIRRADYVPLLNDLIQKRLAIANYRGIY